MGTCKKKLITRQLIYIYHLEYLLFIDLPRSFKKILWFLEISLHIINPTHDRYKGGLDELEKIEEYGRRANSDIS